MFDSASRISLAFQFTCQHEGTTSRRYTYSQMCNIVVQSCATVGTKVRLPHTNTREYSNTHSIAIFHSKGKGHYNTPNHIWNSEIEQVEANRQASCMECPLRAWCTDHADRLVTLYLLSTGSSILYASVHLYHITVFFLNNQGLVSRTFTRWPKGWKSIFILFCKHHKVMDTSDWLGTN